MILLIERLKSDGMMTTIRKLLSIIKGQDIAHSPVRSCSYFFNSDYSLYSYDEIKSDYAC